MRDRHAWMDFRRLGPRVGVETFCSELVGGVQRPGLVVELSADGLRIERPYIGGRRPPEVAIELEVPAIDEVIWARAAVCFDRIRQAPPGLRAGPLGLLRTTGLRIIGAAARDLRLLRDAVVALHRARDAELGDDAIDDLLAASCYARG
jgi:hypothetical protein